MVGISPQPLPKKVQRRPGSADLSVGVEDPPAVIVAARLCFKNPWSGLLGLGDLGLSETFLNQVPPFRVPPADRSECDPLLPPSVYERGSSDTILGGVCVFDVSCSLMNLRAQDERWPLGGEKQRLTIVGRSLPA